MSGKKSQSASPGGVIRKPDPRSVLKTPENPERMAEIYAYLVGDPGTKTKAHTYVQTIEWLAQQKIKVTPRCLWEFKKWYGELWLPMQQANDVTKWAEEYLNEHPELKLRGNDVSIVCQVLFEAQALKTKNANLHLALKRAAQKDRTLELQEQTRKAQSKIEREKLSQRNRALNMARARLKLLQDREKKALGLLEEKITPEEKERRMKAVFGLTE